MKKYLPIVWVLLRFLVVYIILVAIYQIYLNYYNETLKTCDPFTEFMACQCKFLLDVFGYNTQVVQVGQEPSVWLFFNNTYVSKVTEGCNAISVMILFVAFMIGFYEGIRKTSLYIVLGILLIHFSNVIRGSFISYVYYKFPQYSVWVHDYIFPAIIYAVVISLWLYWMKYIVLKDEEKTN